MAGHAHEEERVRREENKHRFCFGPDARRRATVMCGLREDDVYYPQHSTPWVVSGLVLAAAIFVPLGVAIYVPSADYQEVVVEYGDGPGAGGPCTYNRRLALTGRQNPTPDQIPTECKFQVRFTVKETLSQPVFMYYSLTNFNQNFRNLVRSLSYTQLQGGTDCSCADKYACPPFINVGDNRGKRPNEGDLTVHYTDGTSGPLKYYVYSPCGQMAYTFFNDSFVLTRMDDAGVARLVCNTSDFGPVGEDLGRSSVTFPGEKNLCAKKDIAWSGDHKVKFKPVSTEDKVFSSHGSYRRVLNVTNGKGEEVRFGAEILNRGDYWREYGHPVPTQHDLDYMVWSKASSTKTVTKLLREFTTDIAPGTYSLGVQDRYDTSLFGQKKIVIATRSWVGADNSVLAASCISVGALAFIFAVSFVFLGMLRPQGGYTPEAMQSIES